MSELGGEPVCPAAFPIAGVASCLRGVVCRAMQQDVERDDGTALGMSADRFGFMQHEAEGGVHLNLKSDPSTVLNFCYGDAVPVVSDEEGQGRASYTYCPVWVAEKERIEAGRDQLVVEQQPESVSMGVSSDDFSDPWAAARRGLDELAPKKAA